MLEQREQGSEDAMMCRSIDLYGRCFADLHDTHQDSCTLFERTVLKGRVGGMLYCEGDLETTSFR